MADKLMTFSETTRLLKKFAAAQANPSALAPHYDGTTGEYDNLAEWVAQKRDGRVYGSKFPKYSYSNSPDGIKTRDNAGLVCEVSTNTTAGRDDYARLSLFLSVDVNATVDADGREHVTAMDGFDDRFKRDGSNGDVWVLAPNPWYRVEQTATHVEVLATDGPAEGFAPLATYTDGTARPFVLIAKYQANTGSDNIPVSVSGREVSWRFGSQTAGFQRARAKGPGYSAFTHADLFWIQLMLMLKYGTKNAESIGGCTNYNWSLKATMAETGVNRVVVSAADGAKVLVGSRVNVGVQVTDKGAADASSVAAARRVTRVEPVDAQSIAVYIDGDPIDVTVDNYLHSIPWGSGECDAILGKDGRPHAGANKNWQPLRIQGVEAFVGCWTPVVDVILNAKLGEGGEGVVEYYACADSAKHADSITSDYTKLGETLPAQPAGAAAAWLYTEDIVESAKLPGLLVPVGAGATSTTGNSDGVYVNAAQSQGTRELLSLGTLYYSGQSGLFAVRANCGLGSAGWTYGGRLSALGRSKPLA